VVTRQGSAVTVTAISDLTASGVTVYYHWYVDGTYAEMTTSPTRTFYLSDGDQSNIEVIPTLDSLFDPIANAPIAYPDRRVITWHRSLSSDVDHYRVEQEIGESASWAEIGRVSHDDGQWYYTFVTERLTDLTTYAWRIVPVDTSGNETTPGAASIAASQFVRVPDAPEYTATFDDGTDKVTFAAG
jgi:hypothetical protein